MKKSFWFNSFSNYSKRKGNIRPMDENRARYRLSFSVVVFGLFQKSLNSQFRECFFNNSQSFSKLLFGDHKWGSKPDDVFVSWFGK